jgi:SIR2-like domain
MPVPDEEHYQTVAAALADHRVVPLLGAGVNRVGRPTDTSWQLGLSLPDARELAAHLAQQFNYPTDQAADLVRVSQYIEVMTGSGPLYQRLRAVFDFDYPPTVLHRLLARLPRLHPPQPGEDYPLIVTTNYDDALERAFREIQEPFDVVAYQADRPYRGKFLHVPPDGEPVVVDQPNVYRAVSPKERSVILKLHGAINRQDPDRDSYVITEDHYLDYLTRTDVSGLVPVLLAAKLCRSHFLFLGYSMRDWNLRVILHRIWGAQARSFRSWAIQLKPDRIDERFWSRHEVEILDAPLDQYTDALEAHLTAVRAVEAS